MRIANSVKRVPFTASEEVDYGALDSQRRGAVEKTTQVDHLLNDVLNPGPVLETAMQGALEAVGLRYGGIYVRDGEWLTLNALRAPSELEAHIPSLSTLSTQDDVVRLVIGKRRNVEVSLADFTENPACEALLAAGYTHALLIPVIAMGEVMGMLALVLTRPARLGAWEEAFLRSMAERVGVAIHRDRLSRELVEKARQLNRHQHEVTGLNHLFVLHQQEEAVCWQRIGAIAQDLLCEVQKLATMHQSLARDQAASFHTTTPAP